MQARTIDDLAEDEERGVDPHRLLELQPHCARLGELLASRQVDQRQLRGEQPRAVAAAIAAARLPGREEYAR